MNANIRILTFEISKYFIMCVFLTMGFSDSERLSQLYLELVDAYTKKNHALQWIKKLIKSPH